VTPVIAAGADTAGIDLISVPARPSSTEIHH
jgi:hypothetical protein